MTCIVALTAPGRIYVGGDSCASDRTDWVTTPTPKIFTVQDCYLIGCAGGWRMNDLLRYSLQVDLQPDDQTVDAHMRTTFVAAVRKLFATEGYMSNNEGRDSGGRFVVGYRNKIFEVQNDFSVLAPPPWGVAIGSGEVAARASLHTTRTGWDCRQRISQALEAAEATTNFVRSPFLIIEGDSWGV